MRGTIAPKNWAGMNIALPPFAERQHYGVLSYGAHQWLEKKGPVSARRAA